MDSDISQLILQEEELKHNLDMMRPFSDIQLQNLKQRFRIGYIQQTNALEGNTLTLSEVKVLLEDGITIGGKTIREIRETTNHAEIMTLLWDLFDHTINTDITLSRILNIHRWLMDGTLDTRYLWSRRDIQVVISGSEDQFPHPSQVETLMNNFIASSDCNPHWLENIARIHYNFVKIHPFVDGNGRIARLLMNIGLIKCWYFPIIIPTVTRHEYISSLQGDNFESWYRFFVRQVIENHKDYIRFFTK